MKFPTIKECKHVADLNRRHYKYRATVSDIILVPRWNFNTSKYEFNWILKQNVK